MCAGRPWPNKVRQPRAEYVVERFALHHMVPHASSSAPARLPAAAKLAAAAIALAWLVGYLALTGRGARAEGDEPDLRAGPAT